jgi:hypothetical protein
MNFLERAISWTERAIRWGGRIFERINNPYGFVDTNVLPSASGITWTHPVDDYDFARTNRMHMLTYCKDTLGGYTYEPWKVQKLVPSISIADRRLQSDTKSFQVQLIAHETSYKYCQTPVALWLAGAHFDFLPETYQVDLEKWHRYVTEMTARRYRVFATLQIAATSIDHCFELFIPKVPPRLRAKMRTEAEASL